MSDLPFVSVIIPVFNDAARLKNCLAALSCQTYDPLRFEVVVVDNGSAHLEQITAVTCAYPWVRLAQELTPGSYAARNRGLALAQGAVIAFTDADCVPAPDWLSNGVHCLQSTANCGLVVGKVDIFFNNPQAPTPVELYEAITAFPQEYLLHQFQGGATANVFTYRHVIEAVGPFDPQLKARGDLEWGKRVYDYGFRQIYAESVVVGHPARATFADLYRRTRRLMGGTYDLQNSQVTPGWRQQVWFMVTLVQHLIPPVAFTVNAFLDQRLTGLGTRLQVSWVMVVVRYVSAWELLRLKLGGHSMRA